MTKYIHFLRPVWHSRGGRPRLLEWEIHGAAAATGAGATGSVEMLKLDFDFMGAALY